MTPRKNAEAETEGGRVRGACAGHLLSISAVPTAVTTTAERVAQTRMVTEIRLLFTARA